MYRGVVKHALRLGLLLVAFVFALSACGGGGGAAGGGAEVEEEQAKTRTLPGYGDLRPGKYTTDDFEPAFSFEVVGKGWVVPAVRKSGPPRRGRTDIGG